MTNKPILALDFDQILGNYCSPFIGYAISKGFQLDINSKFSEYNMSSWFLNMTNDQFVDLIHEYNSHEHPPLFPGVREIVPKLQEKYNVVVVSSYSSCPTTRQRRAEILTVLGITDMFLLDLGEGKYETLCEIGNGGGQNIFVDDSVKHMEEGLKAGWKVATIEYPYNKGVEGVVYMNSLNELLEE